MKFILTADGMVESEYSQGAYIPGPLDLIDKYITDPLTDKTKDVVREHVYDLLLTILDALREFTVEMIGAIALVGGGVLILLKVAGFDKGYKWAGILFVANVLVKFLLGGNKIS